MSCMWKRGMLAMQPGFPIDLPLHHSLSPFKKNKNNKKNKTLTIGGKG